MQLRSYGKYSVFFAAMVLTLFAGSCAKKATVPPPPQTVATPPVAPPARPTVTLRASQTFIQKGESVTLSWSSTNATELNLTPGPGRISPEGSTQVSPSDSTTYSISAKGPGGSDSQTVRITVAAAAVEQPRPGPAPKIEELFKSNVLDAYFDYDQADIRADARQALAKTAEFLRAYPQLKISVEGHCDERGSTEYNLALGDRRAEAAKQFLISLGVDGSRMEKVSWGKERPFCTESNEACWQQNRRGHFVLTR
ncbi:MAG: peptidoglycan-associated lipoprotein Pal [Acidobacteria bacterium]|nr:peptidoglycan-associated lipoprotein Pal [Acidobacteriota bacterium]